MIIVAKEVESAPSVFVAKLFKLLEEEEKSVTNVHALVPPPLPCVSSPESIISTLGELLEKTVKPHSDSNAYRCLRIFSYSVPTPPGEETMENWIEQARLMITECDCSDKEKEGLWKVLKALLWNCALEYIAALESAFGTSESGEDLYFVFRLLWQNSGEALSDFLCKLEWSLTRVVQRGGLSPQIRDRACVEQLIRGTVEADMMLLKLRLRERKGNPPSFLNLLTEIREEEENEATRHKLDVTVKPVHLRNDPKSEIQELKAETKELNSQIRDMLHQKEQVPLKVTDVKEKSTKNSSDAHKDSEVRVLKNQVQLQHQITVMLVAHPFSVREDHPLNTTTSALGLVGPPKNKDDYFCYQCGEDGHIATHCKAPENSAQVIQKLIRSLQKAKAVKVAHAYSTDTVTVAQKVQRPAKVDPALFNFGESPLPETWKNRLRQKLSGRRGVFSLDEWDVGLAFLPRETTKR
ncbi:hypothetical protein SRHO_G00279700 [Serrasalmus rhombeus]